MSPSTSSYSMTPGRYHALPVSLHWLLAIMIVFSLGAGMFSLKAIDNSSPDKILALRGHMVASDMALYHQFVRREKLLSRMWFGKG